jgi:protein-S-isoprenylcysteine O-methyltransferase Ste14
MASEGQQAPPRRHEHGPRARSVVLVLLAPVFLLGLPCLVVGLGARIDLLLQARPVPPVPVNLVVGILLIGAGCLLGLWSNERLFTAGRGTPLPVMPTQQLVVQPPYTYVRNPMALGAIAMYLGVALLFQSLGAILVVLLLSAALLAYIRLSEERQLVARFGRGYVEYRRRTPFLIPRLRVPGRGR